MRKFLERYGWKRIEARKQGCFKQVLWLDTFNGGNTVWPQHMAVEIQRSRNKYKPASADVADASGSNATAPDTAAASVA